MPFARHSLPALIDGSGSAAAGWVSAAAPTLCGHAQSRLLFAVCRGVAVFNENCRRSDQIEAGRGTARGCESNLQRFALPDGGSAGGRWMSGWIPLTEFFAQDGFAGGDLRDDGVELFAAGAKSTMAAKSRNQERQRRRIGLGKADVEILPLARSIRSQGPRCQTQCSA